MRFLNILRIILIGLITTSILSPILLTNAIGERLSTAEALARATIPPTDRTDIARRLLGIVDTPAIPTMPPARTIGEQQTFYIINSGTQLLQAESELVAISDHAYIWTDITNPLNANDALQFARRFDQEVYAPLREVWGSEPLPGIDGDTRLYIVFSDQVGASTGAYFTSQNLYPASIVPNSNEHEMLIINRNLTNGGIANDTMLSVAAHEFQHMIRYNQRPNTATWLDEGFSMFTEQYLGWQGNQWAINAFMMRPHTQLNTWRTGSERSAHYGAGMLFVGYLYEQCGLEGLHAISQTNGNGMAIVDTVVQACAGMDVAQFTEDWTLANYLHSRPHSPYGYRSAIWQDTPIPRPQIRHTMTTPTAEFQLTTEQWSADYIPLNALQGGDTLQLTLQGASTLPLISTSAYSGRWMWYSHNADQSNTRLTHAFDLRTVTDARLTYQTWYDLEEGWDYAYVTISADNGQTWHRQTTPHMAMSNPFGRAYGAGYTGASNGWVEEQIDLGAYEGQEILFRIEMITDDAVTHQGIVIDDIRLDAIGYADDAETSAGNWQAEGWVRINNTLSQIVSLMLIEESDNDIAITRWQHASTATWQHTLADTTDNATLVILPVTDFTTQPAQLTLTLERAP